MMSINALRSKLSAVARRISALSNGDASRLTKAHPLARYSADEFLRRTGVAERPAGRVDARRDCRIRDNPASPDTGDHIVSADNALSVLHEVNNQVENLRFDLDSVPSPTQFATVYIKRMFSEFVPHWPLLGRPKRWLMKR
jgi:hypothetical protein